MQFKQLVESLVLVLLVCLFTGVSSLRCFQCSGQTNYDPDSCFNPDEENTITTECPYNDESSCEKRVERIDRRMSVINRGCTANCGDREYVYTDDFQVYCCKDDACNGATHTHASHTLLVTTTLTTIVMGTLIHRLGAGF